MTRLLDIALTQYGIREIAGPENNPEVLKWFSATDQATAEWVNDDTPSCSAFIAWCMEQAGLPSTRSVTARSWDKWGELVTEPQPGDLAVYWREAVESWKGHVGIVVKADEKVDWVLGANQDNMVCIKAYDRTRLLCYRRHPETMANKIINSVNTTQMKGWKTIIVAVLTAALAGVDAITNMVNIPQWYYAFVVPGLMFVLRFLTDGPVFGDKK